MSRLKIETPNRAQKTVEQLYKDLERHIEASPPGLCPVELQLAFLKLCHAQTCGKCVPCRIGLGQLQKMLEEILEGRAPAKPSGSFGRPHRILQTPRTALSATRPQGW